MPTLRLAVAGVGNCASALLQGLEYYRTHELAHTSGLLHAQIGGYRLGDLRVVSGFHVDERKVGRPHHEAPFPAPNCTNNFSQQLRASASTLQTGPPPDRV